MIADMPLRSESQRARLILVGLGGSWNPTHEAGTVVRAFGFMLTGTAEWFLSLYLVVGFLNSEMRFSVVASAPIKIALALTTTGLFLTSWRGSRKKTGRASLRWLVGPLAIYLTTVLLVTFQYGASSKVVSVFLLAAVAAVLLLSAEYLSTGSAVRCIRRAAVIHVVLALLIWGGPGVRADGGSHPITVGFAAGLLVFLSGSPWTLGRADLFIRGGVFLLGLVGLYAAFSRSAIIPCIIGVTLWLIFHPGLLRPSRVMVAAALVPFGGLAWGAIVLAFSQNDVAGFYSGTGRLGIWSRVWSLREIYIGHGIGLSNIDGSSVPGAQLLSGSLNLPTENSLMQALINAGVIGAASWCLLVGGCLILIARAPWPSFTRVGLIALIVGGCIFNAGFAGSGFGFPLMIGLAASAARMPRSDSYRRNRFRTQLNNRKLHERRYLGRADK